MKGIYITEEGKKELQNKRMYHAMGDPDDYFGNVKLIEEILESAIVLPVEKSWVEVCSDYDDTSDFFKRYYPNGLIIQPK